MPRFFEAPYSNSSDAPPASVQIDWVFNDGNTGMQGSGGAQSVTDSSTVNITAVNDAPTGDVTISGVVAQGRTLTAAHTLNDADGLGAIRYQWNADGVTINGATASTYTLTQWEVERTITVTARYVDGQGTVESVTSSQTPRVANLNYAPTGTVTISGTTTQGQTLTVGHTLADEDGLGTISYQWSADGIEINHAVGSSYTLTQAEVGKTISVTASYTDGGGTRESVMSDPTAAVLPLGSALEGLVYHWKSHALLTGAEITIHPLVADPDLPAVPEQQTVDGHFGFEGLAPGEYALQAGKTLSPLESGGVINSADALAALKIAVGRNPNADPDGSGPLSAPPVSPYQFIAADVNQDGKVSSADALAILKMALQRSDAPQREWLFVAETEDFWNEAANNGTGAFTTTRSTVTRDLDGFQFSMPETATANQVAVLKGDVNGNWAPPAGSELLADSHFLGLQAAGIGPAAQWGVLIA